MAPRRGGGGGTSGGGGGGSSDDESSYDPTLYFQLDERRAITAEAACAALLALAAISALLMVIVKSWPTHDGRRNKPRLVTFLLCLCFIVIGRAVAVANFVLTLQGPNQFSLTDLAQHEAVYDYYNTKSFDARRIVIELFAWLSTSLFFGLVLVEVTRPSAPSVQRRTAFENFNFLTIFVLSALVATNWIITTLGLTGRLYYHDLAEYTRVGLDMAYLVISLFFATVMYFSKKIPASRIDASSKPRSSVLRFVIGTLWVNQALYIAAYATAAWGSHLDLTPTYAMWATTDVLWAILVLGMATLAWKSHRNYSAVPTQPETVHYGNVFTEPGMAHYGGPYTEYQVVYPKTTT